MFAQLYIIYIFFLVSAAVGIPVVNLQNQTFSTDGLVPTRPKCTDPNNAKYKSSVCATRKLARVSCESNDNPGTVVDTNFSCGDGESCVDITSNDVLCVDENNALVWENNHYSGFACSAPVLLVPPHESFQLVAGMTTYSTTGDPIQVVVLLAKYGDNESREFVGHQNNFTFAINQGNFSKNLSFCFAAGNEEEIQAVASLGYVLL
ncbi:uncharacterized protein OCT59_027303 [Rhizophagus irregularis]|uniref:Uncharacterized protein n=2 Tax=Rhizophagus irregularis TaxID=588596 RepID=A0A015JV80_RHIIW|nr:hypothetical protein GLOIN_2v1837647 [Rhizophagus irregularis DAOM 181602=DAOM 197198]EXX59009.1 hypothetical protein RirG_192590 [Rhizophagus irregularis DAOM 197198w]UZO06999.1 hypothetical protein OCT59_027303 [Rhizophagus irregularis]POG77222.1 hypothetical protein GLOIN_2v1837647 [Rhizophagus irregularis DAOM 181602=DAOM 197198]CAB4373630.1 unnamed protein product [Rhizophagus irregularis]CAB5356789.1 unnamed protein product [Rhizophagus irregularis]|eukprot:XP_025184088.1 hypothetical protein GLOIN_2v1837647 [Rhizophagus irregularis DAOM 181602=DAOM 197198]